MLSGTAGGAVQTVQSKGLTRSNSMEERMAALDSDGEDAKMLSAWEFVKLSLGMQLATHAHTEHSLSMTMSMHASAHVCVHARTHVCI